MPKNSRPDIQVLEARVVRLKAQLLEYKEIRIYDITKQRLSNVALELEECISIIGDITEQGKTEHSNHKIALKEPETAFENEFNDDGDLADIKFMDFIQKRNGSSDTTEQAAYSPSKITSEFRIKIAQCADTPTGIVQVNQVCLLLNSWYSTRFSADTRNPKFFFKAARIHEWIDLILLASGEALATGTFPTFKAYMDAWIGEINTSKDNGYLLPLKVRKITDKPTAYTKEAVLLEKIIKPILYSDSFYPEEKTSIEKIVIDNTGFTHEELCMDELMKACPRLIPTSSFDITKYREEAM